MNSDFYIKRKFTSGDRKYSEAELLTASNYLVVLAEPGGGKTELMRSFARQLDTTTVTASEFGFKGAKEENSPLVIDAFDELAKVDQSGIYHLFKYASLAKPTRVIISSRSSEWGQDITYKFEQFLGCAPLIVWLCEFNQDEQRAIFEHHVPGEDFAAFQAEVTRFDLAALLPNPQFQMMFARAYIQSERRFPDKQSIFSLAVESLAREANKNITRTTQPLSVPQKIDFSAQVFARLLLSAAEGVSISEASESRIYPALPSLFNGNTAYYGILATLLFKPGDNEDQHRPVHKIIAEYCAAGYLIKRIADPADPLTLPKCLSVIAPNSTVRDELRGLIGWMAALGNRPIQEATIELDPYAVIANGDPSQLEHSSKSQLLGRLKEIESSDPYFRRGDFWRRFSVAGFFTPNMIEEIKPLLATDGEGQLRDLLLELLTGSPVTDLLAAELRQFTLEPAVSEHTRQLANRCLLEVSGYHFHDNLAVLIFEASDISLSLAADIIGTVGSEKFDTTYLTGFLRVCANLYPGREEENHREVLGSRYFIKRLISCFSQSTLESLLDELSKKLTCNCGKQFYECDCRNGISKIIGSMLDCYFALAQPPFDPVRVWMWVGELYFRYPCRSDQSKAVQTLQESENLRQGMIAYTLGSLTDREQIFQLKVFKFEGQFYSHSGLQLCQKDHQFIVDLAFELDNVDLWASFIVPHRYHSKKEERASYELRRHMREQALDKPLFMREWARYNQSMAQHDRERQASMSKYIRGSRRYHRRLRVSRAANIEFIQENRRLVEDGKHGSFLVHFANLVLCRPTMINQEIGDEALVRTALRNSLDFITPRIPDLCELAKLRCESKYLPAEAILYAACLEIMRVQGHLENVDLRLLKALRARSEIRYDAVSEEEHHALNTEVSRLVFPDSQSTESYLREYLEPQLAQPCAYPEVEMLRRQEVFRHLSAPLSMEWIRRFSELKLETLDILFEIAARYANRCELNELIAERSSDAISDWRSLPVNEKTEEKRSFWLVRAIYFLDEVPDHYWEWLKSDKENLVYLYQRTGRQSLSEHWPKLTSSKIEVILKAFSDELDQEKKTQQDEKYSYSEYNQSRFLKEMISTIEADDPDNALPVLKRLLSETVFASSHRELQSAQAVQIRKKALRDFQPPTPQEIVNLLDSDDVVTVEGLRQLVLYELQDFQKAINGGEFNSADRFYEKGERLNEVRSTEIIAERLDLRLKPQGIFVTLEHQLKGQNRSDFTVSKFIAGKKRLVVTEVKGQWHRELYTAAAVQLHDRYSIHPDARQQGIFLVIWFGADGNVAGRKSHNVANAQELKLSVEATLPAELKGLIDVFVLDVSRS